MPDNAHGGSISSDDSLYFANSAAGSGGSDTDLFGVAEDPSGKFGTVNTPQFMHNRNPPKVKGGVRPGSSGPTGVINLTPGARNIP
jgi:hypothetical protein